MLNVTAEGDVLALIDYIAKLNGDFATGLVKSAEIHIPAEAGGSEVPSEEPAVGESESEETEIVEVGKPSAVIQLIIYTYRGD